ncbi:MAG: type II toxin-antitoxin system RelE/ParE family toxin [Actinobacteria bacterium]|nr:type II toxin-antitoxin system RelE/ParE family toxin [Actinomycetota bacterium]MBE3114965.1 type II toxin-antitoxin system RelE/ParE family toxin [Actinomycetota bacterium]
MKIIQSPLFQKQKKKLYKKQIKILDEEIKKIAGNPKKGQEKRGSLKGVRVYKFHIEKQLFLLAYELEIDVLKLIMVGSHGNYYRDLTKYYNE